VFDVGEDPVRLGLVASLARPGGNATGINFFGLETNAKRLGLMHDLLPNARRFAVLLNPANASSAAAVSKQVGKPPAPSGRVDALYIAGDSFLSSRGVQLATLAVRDRLPASSNTRELAAVGLLMSYGTDVADTYRQVGIYTGSILNGVKPTKHSASQFRRRCLRSRTRSSSKPGLWPGVEGRPQFPVLEVLRTLIPPRPPWPPMTGAWLNLFCSARRMRSYDEVAETACPYGGVRSAHCGHALHDAGYAAPRDNGPRSILSLAVGRWSQPLTRPSLRRMRLVWTRCRAGCLRRERNKPRLPRVPRH
jgi:hypothetical protein